MPFVPPNSVLVADPANFLKANGAAYIRIGSIVMAAYECAPIPSDAGTLTEKSFKVTSLHFQQNGASTVAKKDGGWGTAVYYSSSSGMADSSILCGH